METITYKKFLIMSNLRCYVDDNGVMRPKFVHTEFKTVDEAKARIDKYYEEFEQWESRRRINYAKSLAVLNNDSCGHDSNTDAEDFAARVDAYYDNQLNEDI